MCKKFTIVLLTLAISLNTVTSYTADDLRTHLDASIPANGADQYLTYVRPVNDQNHILNVTADLYLIGINGFDNSEQKLTTTAYLEVKWTDEIIRDNWQNAGISTIYIPQNNVWLPDIALQNGFTSMSGLGSSFLYVTLEQDGTVTWRPYHVFESSCEVDVTFFPFDKTTCDMQFVIWSNTKDRVFITKGTVEVNTESYEKNSEWDVLATSASNYESSTSSGVTFSIEMKRKPLYYLLNIIIPVVLLGVLNAFVFVLPASSGEKTGYSVTAFLSFAVFLTIISTELPQNSEKVSTCSAYIFLMTLVSTIIVTITIIQLHYFNQDEDKPITGKKLQLITWMRKLQCTFCTGSGHVAVDEKKLAESQEVTWATFSDAVDFFCFWIFLIFTALFTAIILGVSASG